MPTTTSQIDAISEKDKLRFWSKVEKKEPDECWPWLGAVSTKGYGSFWVGNTNRRAHRIALFLSKGRSEDGMFALHSCDNPPCCNPAHLRWGTTDENMAEMLERNRHGAHGEGHHKHKLTDSNVREIRETYARGGVTQKQLSAIYGITQANISKAILRQSWRLTK